MLQKAVPSIFRTLVQFIIQKAFRFVIWFSGPNGETCHYLYPDHILNNCRALKFFDRRFVSTVHKIHRITKFVKCSVRTYIFSMGRKQNCVFSSRSAMGPFSGTYVIRIFESGYVCVHLSIASADLRFPALLLCIRGSFVYFLSKFL